MHDDLEHAQLQSSVVLVASVGNTRTRLGVVRSGELSDAAAFDNADLAGLIAHARAITADHAGLMGLVASVNEPVAKRVIAALEEEAGEVYRVGRDVMIPMDMSMDEPATVGHDRLLACLAAFRLMKQACVVVDAGTAITVNFVDGTGTFQGGVIAPGLKMMLASMHAHAAQLPALSGNFEAIDATKGPFGKSTAHAMQLGVVHAARGLVRHTVESFAEAYEAYPTVIATGGDAEMLFEGDGLIERIVPDLVLLGMAELCKVREDDDQAGDDNEDMM